MAYNLELAERVQEALKSHPEMTKKKMFGGVGYMLRGNLACGVWGNELMVRIGEERSEDALALSYVRQFMPMPGKPALGWILVGQEGIQTVQDLNKWINQGLEFAATLPEKK